MIFGRAPGKLWWKVAVWLGFACSMWASAPEMSPVTRDALVYKDGDRIHGWLVQQTGDTIVFKSERFGELRVAAADAVVIPADTPTKSAATPPPAPKPAAATAATSPAPAPPAAVAAAPVPSAASAAKTAADARTRREEERMTMWDRYTPALMTARVRSFFGPWKGRIAFSTEVVSDVADRENSSWEARVQRKWEKNELQFNARFDYAKTNGLRTTDMYKTASSFRHEFTKKHFAHYRPTAEWNRASRRQGVPNRYVLLQQEIGFGYHLLTTPARKVRLGLSQNRFDVWNRAPTPEHTSRGVQSAFEEIELKLPWQMGFTQRGAWYPVKSRRDGWENRIELNKKLTETLSTSVRHEIRRHNPDGSAQDFERLKLLFALDF
jgi:hypothetical protein